MSQIKEFALQLEYEARNGSAEARRMLIELGGASHFDDLTDDERLLDEANRPTTSYSVTPATADERGDENPIDVELIEQWRAGDLNDLAETCYPLAMRYLVDLRWSIVPQQTASKKVHVKWREYRKRRPRPGELYDWYTHWPQAGIALVLGPMSDAMAVDVDSLEAHRALLAKLDQVPIAPKSFSGSGKQDRYHLLFKHPRGVATAAKFCPWHPQLEFRGDGGLIVLPPSLHRSGRHYRWAEGSSPWELRLPPLPGPVVAEWHIRAQRCVSNVDLTRDRREQLHFQRVMQAASLSQATLQFLRGKFAFARGWNERIFCAACDLAGIGISIELAIKWLLAGAKPMSPEDEAAALRTIESAYAQDRLPAKQFHQLGMEKLAAITQPVPPADRTIVLEISKKPINKAKEEKR